jgi:ribonuclease G
MTDEILINVTPQETRVAVIGSGQVQELIVERTASRGLVGNICMGRVARVLPGIQRVRRDRPRARRVPARRRHLGAPAPDRRREPPDRAHPGRRPAAAGAGREGPDRQQGRAPVDAGLDRGRLLVYLPHDPHIGISQRIEDENRPRSCCATLKELLPRDEKGGFILRTLAETASEDELRADIEYLRHLWRDIGERALHAHAPALALPGPVARAARAARHGVGRHRASAVDSRENFQKLAAFADTTCPTCARKLEHYTGERPLFDLYNVETEIEKALSRRVDSSPAAT